MHFFRCFTLLNFFLDAFLYMFYMHYLIPFIEKYQRPYQLTSKVKSIVFYRIANWFAGRKVTNRFLLLLLRCPMTVTRCHGLICKSGKAKSWPEKTVTRCPGPICSAVLFPRDLQECCAIPTRVLKMTC